MNDIFNLKRFLRYSRLYYTNKWLAIVTSSAATAFAVLLFCSNLSVSGGVNETFSTLHAAKLDLTEQFTVIFFIAGFALTNLLLRVLCSGLDAGNKRFLMQDILIPASSTERYCFGLLNCTVIIPLLYLLIFWGTSTYAESLYYFPTDGTTTSYIYKGLLNFSQTTIPAGYEQIDIFNYESLNRLFTFGIDKSTSILPIIAALYLLIISTMMWGMLTFKKDGVVFSSLIHIAIVSVIGCGSALIVDSFGTTSIEYDLRVVDIFNLSSTTTTSWLIYIVAAAIIYQIITFMKIKNLSVNN